MANITLRTNEEVKREAAKVYSEWGIDLSTAINVFLRRSIQCGGFPFLVQTEFNTATQNAFKEAEEIASDKRAAKRFHSVSETVAHIMGDNDDEV